MDARTEPSEAKYLTHQEARFIVFGMLLPVFVGSLDNTILASALPTIGREFNDSHNLPWLIAIYLLASTAVVPLYGKVSDIHGRRFTLLIAIALHMLGSLACALAPNMLSLILARALQGLGGGGLASTGAIVLGDIAAPKERGRYYAYFAVIYTTAGAIGPALGGFLSDYIHWSAIFWMNIPLGLACLAVTVTVLRRLPRHERPHKLDVIGAVLIVTASVAFMFGLNLGGKYYPWTSAPVLVLFAIALAVGAGFVWRLLTAPEPLIPIKILSDRTVRCCVVAHAFGWSSIVCLNIYLPIYLQNVAGLSATNAGLSLMMLMIALNISAGSSAYMLGSFRRYKLLPMIAMLVAIASTATLALSVESLSLVKFEILLMLIGAGFGPMPGLAQTALQNSVGRHQLGISVGTMTFSRNLLATMLVALFGAIIASALVEGAKPDPVLGAEAFRYVFLGITATLTVAFVAIVLIEEKPLQSGVAEEAK
jgi:MFS family permease